MKKKLISFVIGILIVISFIEITIRISASFYKTEDVISKDKIPTDDVVKVMTIGESTTAVAADDTNSLLVQKTAYPNYLEEILNQNQKKIKFKVYNKGIMSGNTDKIILELEKQIQELRPNIIIAMMGMKDEIRDFEEPTLAMKTWIKLKKILSYSKAIILIEEFYEQIRVQNNNIKDFNVVKKFSDIPYEFASLNQIGIESSLFRQIEIDKYDENILREILKQLYLANYYLLTGQLQSAESIYVKLIQKYDFGYFFLSDLYIRDNKILEAEKVLIDYMKKYPQNPYVYRELINLYLSINKMNEAKLLLNEMNIKRLNFENVNLLTSADYFRKLNLFNNSLEILRPYCGLEQQLKFKRIIISEKYIEKMIMKRKNRDFFECVFLISESLFNLKKYVQAEQSLLNFIQIAPDHAGAALNLLVKIYQDEGRTDKIKEVIKKVANRNQRLGEFYSLAQTFDNEGNGKEVNELLTKLSEDFVKTKSNYTTLKSLADKYDVKLVLVQYPTFKLNYLKYFTSKMTSITYVDNEKTFDDGPRQKYFFEPRFPYTFNHYTKLGSKKIAENISRIVLRDLF